jgi:hypothetical protein
VVVLYHGWEELLGEEVVGECVDVECEADIGFCGIEDALLIRTVGSPKCALISEDADAIEAGDARSHLKNLTVGCAVDILAVPSLVNHTMWTYLGKSTLAHPALQPSHLCL